MAVTNDTDSEEPKFTLTLSGGGISIDQEVDRETALEVVAIALGASGGGAGSTSQKKKPRGRRRSQSAGGTKSKARRRKAGSPGLAKDLSLRPQGKVAFKDFAEQKAPRTHQEKGIVVVHWLKREANVAAVTVDHVNTCYVEAGWKRPADLDNALQVTAGKKGWLDTSNMDDIKLTPRGEDFVKHDLPRQPKK